MGTGLCGSIAGLFLGLTMIKFLGPNALGFVEVSDIQFLKIVYVGGGLAGFITGDLFGHKGFSGLKKLGIATILAPSLGGAISGLLYVFVEIVATPAIALDFKALLISSFYMLFSALALFGAIVTEPIIAIIWLTRIFITHLVARTTS